MTAAIPIPDDFAEKAGSMHIQQAVRYWSRNRDTIRRWYIVAGIKPVATPKSSVERPIPDGFSSFYIHNSMTATARRFNAGIETVMRWADKAGIRRTGNRPLVVQVVRPRSSRQAVTALNNINTSKNNRDMSLAGRAVDECLKKLGPVWRCNAEGRPTQGGKFWRRGSAVLTDAEVVERARAKGWDPDAWKRVPARLAGAVA